MAGYLVVAHGGVDAVPVARSTAMPFWCNRPITRSSQ
jgi:hypothetical protein